MKAVFPNKELENENDVLVEKYLSSQEEISLQDFVDKHASEKYKKYLAAATERKRRLYAKGIVVN